MASLSVASNHQLEDSLVFMKTQHLAAYYIIGVTDRLPPQRIISDSNIVDLSMRKTLLLAELNRLENLFPIETSKQTVSASQEDASACRDCGSLMVRTGSCYTCTECGTTGGCG